VADCALCHRDPKTGQWVTNAGCHVHGVAGQPDPETEADRVRAENDR
jgi:hypothetical protein